MEPQRTTEIRLAVLPFQEGSARGELADVAVGFVEDLITNLSKFIGLSVISQYSTMQILPPYDPGKIAHLHADFLVTGSFRLLAGKVRIGVQLVSTQNDRVVFAGQHEAEMEKLLQVMDSIVHQLVNALQQHIDSDLLSFSYRKFSTPLVTYRKWLQGITELKRGTEANDEKARAYFHEALAIDPNFSRAYTGISLSYFNEWSCLLWDRWDVCSRGAREYALKALEIDGNDYQALMVLGRTYLYTGEFGKAEHCFRKSVRMNPNDANNLAGIAFWITYLGYLKEAEEWYRKAVWLNPLRGDEYNTYGAFIYFELGEFQKSLELIDRINFGTSWVDLAVFSAAIYYELGDYDRMWNSWSQYLEMYRNKVAKPGEESEEDALEWHIKVNPYKGDTRLKPFWNYIRKHLGHPVHEVSPEPMRNGRTLFRHKGDFWEVSYQGQTATIKDMKGLHDIGYLLENPGKEIHCSELMQTALDPQSGVETIDAKAKKEYEKRIRVLQEEIEEAESMNNIEEANALIVEYEKLIEYLANSLGLGGRTRQVNSSLEKARTAVTWRIRSAIKKISRVHPALAKHLNSSIRTGINCSYHPEHEIEWQL